MRKTFQNTGHGWWNEGKIAETLRVGGGDSTKANLVVEVLPFDTTQVTSDKNYSHPTWGGVLPSTRKRSASTGSRDKENRWN